MERRYPCTHSPCEKAFNRKSDLLRHLRIHTNDRPYHCDRCGKKFIQRSALVVHIRTHTGEKPHMCQHPGCGRRFSDSSSLARHRRTHSAERNYRCGGCEKTYRRRNTMVRHQQRDHQGGISGVWVVQDPALADVSWNHGTQQLALPHAPPPPPPNPPPLLPLVSGLPQQPASSATGSFGSPVSPESVTSAAGSFGGPPVTTAGGPFVESPVTSDASSFQTSTHTFAHPTAAPDSLEQQLSMYNFGQAAHQAQQHHQVPLVHHHHHHQSPTGPGGSNHLMHHGGSMPAEPSYIRYFNPNFPAAVGGPQALGGFHHFQWSPDEVKPEEEFEMPNHRLRLSLI